MRFLEQRSLRNETDTVGTRDGAGAADHDQPYHYGRRPTTSVPYPFNTRQYVRLLVLRGRVQDGIVGADDMVLEGVTA